MCWKKIWKVLSYKYFIKKLEIPKPHIRLWKKLKFEDHNKFIIYMWFFFIFLLFLYFLLFILFYVGLIFFIIKIKEVAVIKLIFILILSLISIWLAFLSIGISKIIKPEYYGLTLFCLKRIEDCRNKKEIDDMIYNNKLTVYMNRFKNKVIKLTAIYIGNILVQVDYENELEYIKNYFKKLFHWFEDVGTDNLNKLLLELDEKISKKESYKINLDFIEGLTNIKKEKNIFTFLTKLYEFAEKKRTIIKLKSAIPNFLSWFGKNYMAIFIIITIILLIFNKDLFLRVIEVIFG